MEKADNKNQWKKEMTREEKNAHFRRIAAVKALNRLNQTQWENITEFLSTKLSYNYEKTNKRKT